MWKACFKSSVLKAEWDNRKRTMDAHYDVVMKARAEAGQGRRFYFAYSTILDRPAFEEWRTQHSYTFFDLPQGRVGRALDMSLVFDFPSRWWGGRVAGLRPTAGQQVYGVVFEIADQDWPIIQHKEGAVTGMCVELPMRVQIDGAVVDAVAFSTNPVRASLDGPISSRFVDSMVNGAQAAGLPASWLLDIRRLAAAT